MSETDSFANKQIVEITLVRHSHFYFYTLRINGRPQVNGKPIDRERALEIFNSNQDAEDAYTTGQIDFDEEKPHEWTWTVTRVEEA